MGSTIGALLFACGDRNIFRSSAPLLTTAYASSSIAILLIMVGNTCGRLCARLEIRI